MGNGYTRQSAANITNGLVIYAADINNELNAIQSAFNGTTGHVHDGSIGNGPKISLTSAISGILPVANGGFGGIHNLSATSAPTNLNDVNSGYVIGSIWINTTAQTVYVCVNNASTAAVWQQYQLNNANITALSGLTTAANQLILATGVATFAMTACTALAQTLLSNATTATMQSTLGLVIGTNVQAQNTNLQALSSYNTNGILVQSAANSFVGRTITGTAGQITATNGDGVAGNPTLSLPSAMTMTGITLTGGTYTSASFSGTWTAGAMTSNSATLSGGAITGMTIDSTTIGATTASTGKFTNLTGTSSITALNADFYNYVAAGTAGSYWFQTAGANRWQLSKSNATESGSNAGSNFNISRYNDAGTLIDSPISIVRSTGATTINDLTLPASTTAGATLTVSHGAAPTTPGNGDIWTTTGGLFARINGATFQYASIAGTETLTNKTLTGAALNGTLGATTPSTVAGTTGTFSGNISSTGGSVLSGTGAFAPVSAGTTYLRPNGSGSTTGQLSVDTSGNAVVAGTLSVTTGIGGDVKTYVDNGDIGTGQTWQTVTRTANTVYQNTTSKPIFVSIGVATAGTNKSYVSVDNVTFLQVGITNNADSSHSFIVPQNWYYKCDGGIVFWTELR